MAALIEVENKHMSNLFGSISKAVDLKSTQDAPQQIITSMGETVLAWDEQKSCIRVGRSSNQMQVLLCSNPPLYKVDSILLNGNEDHIALIGNKGVTILELPSAYSPESLFQNGKEQILCKTLPIDEHFFSCHKRNSVLKVLWHPGSPNNSHLCVLMSDNVIRVYSVTLTAHPHKTIRLNDGNSRFSSALGESFVSMTFGSMTSGTTKNTGQWPLYVLTGLGGIFRVRFSLWPSSSGSKIEGPIKMLPAAEDNYGSDASDIVCLDTSPEMIVISTVSGSLIQCLLIDIASVQSNSDGDDTIQLDGCVLYVCDIIKLELILNTPSTDVYDDYTTPVLLYKVPHSPAHYYCIHSAGVHSIFVPWLTKIIDFCQKDGNIPEINDILEDEETQCSHIVCTQPLAGSKSAPIKGFTIVSQRINTSVLLCLLSDFTCLRLIVRDLLGTPSSLISSKSELAKALPQRKSLEKHIVEILQRSTSNPLIKTNNDQELSMERSYQLLTRSTQIFREQYMDKLELAKSELDRRISSLTLLKQQQVSDLENLSAQKIELIETARKLAERYEDVAEENEKLTVRMDAVMTKIQSSIDEVSTAEHEFAVNLKVRRQQVKELKQLLDQVKKKQEYQKQNIIKVDSPSHCLSETQLKRINILLANESKQIGDMVHHLKKLMSTSN